MADAIARKSEPEPEKSRAVSPFQSLQDEMERMIHAFSRPEINWHSSLLRSNGTMGLRVNVGETDGEIHITADMPGVKEADIDVTLDGDVLRIAAEKKAETEKSEEKWHVVERSYGRYERALQVPAGIDPEAVKAGFKDGVLSVTLPKPPQAEPKARKISVSHG